MNKHAKGVRVENLAKKILESKGYVVEKKNWNQFASKDFFGCLDLMAVNKLTGELIFVQVKSNPKDVYRARTAIKECFITEFYDCELWLWEGGDAFKVEKF